MTWTPDFFTAQTSNTWEFRINATSGPDNLTDDEFFVITVANTDRAPDIAPIGDQTVAEGTSITQINTADTSGGDTDIDNEAITYSCQYDTIVSGSILSGTDCSSLPGTVSFNTTTGVFDWQPGFFAFNDGPQYEIEITATSGPDSLTDTEYFVITTTNTDRPPVLAAIGNQVVNEGTAITQVNANDNNTGNDTDIDLEIITYSCVYDSTIDGSVTSSDLCTNVSGLSFDTSTGVLDWTPNFFQSGSYEFKIVGTASGLSDDEIFFVNVNNNDRPPVLNTITDKTVAENAAMPTVNASDANTGGDIDIDIEAITYACTYDTTSDGSVAAGTACTSLPGTRSFNTSTGVLNWTPSFTSAGTYEIKIVGTSGPDTLSDDEIFVVTVTNTDRPPVLTAIANQPSGAEGSAITPINANDNNSGGDSDIDGDAITYTCVYDNTSNGAVTGGTNCTSLPGTNSFNTTTGALTWTPGYFTAQTSNTWEIKITGTSGPDTLSDDEIFVITVANTDRPPVLNAIGDQTIAEASAMAQVDASDFNTGNDTDIDLEAITYSCVYDTVIDGGVSGTTNCTSLSGVSFSTSTGVMDWTPGYFQSGNYEFKIVGTVNSLSDDEIFSITVNNTDRPPLLNNISNVAVAENSIMPTVNASDANTNSDNDIDNESIIYTCTYDTSIDSDVTGGTNCTSLPGTATFSAVTGVLNWTPNFSAAGDYEVKIVGTSGPDTLSDDEIFLISVSNTDRAPSLANINNETVNENVAITQVNANDSNTSGDTDIDGDTLTYSCQYDTTVSGGIVSGTNCNSLPGSANFNTTTGVLDWTPDYTANQSGPQYEIEITATGGPTSLSDTEIFVITVNNVDRAPVIAAIGDFSVNENSAITPVNANDNNTGNDTDIDGDALTYSCQFDTTVGGGIVSGANCSTLPGSANFNTSTGTLTWTPSYTAAATPTYEIEITATGGPDTLSDTEILVITVNNVDRSPVIAGITDRSVNENSAMTQVNADDTSGGDTDIDGDNLTYSCLYDTTVSGGIVSGTACTSLPGTATFNTSTGILDWTPSYTAAQSGPEYEVEITATGGPDTLSDTEIFVVTVNNVDRAPLITAIGDQTVAEDSAITQVNAQDANTNGDTDIDGDTITWTCIYDTVIDSAVAGTSACTDITGLTFNTGTGVMDWTPNFTQAGSYEFKITATAQSLNDTELFSITVNNTDRAPVIATINDFSATENVAMTTVNANDDNTGDDTDIDGDALTYTCVYDTTVSTTVPTGTACTSLPGSATFNTGTGVLNWTPSYSATQDGPQYEVLITATGGPDTLSDEEVFVITVNNNDRPPVVAAIGNQTINENSAMTQVDADDTSGGDTDIDGDTLTYACVYDTTIDTTVSVTTDCTTITGLSFNTTTGVMNWTPNYSQAGDYEFKITATGGPDTLSDDEVFSIIVNNVDRAPVIDTIADETVNENSPITQVNANDGGDDADVDGDTLSYTCQFDTTVSTSIVSGNNCSTLPGTVSFNGTTGVLDWTPNYTAAATPTYEIEITATGGPDSLSDTEIFVITVNNVDRAPVIAAIGDQSVAENSAITIVNANDDNTGNDTDIDGDTITYSCQYDTTVGGGIVSGTVCDSLPGSVTFNTTTGSLAWTPDYTAAANSTYEIEIKGEGGPDTLSDTEIFVITVTNTDRPPVLSAIGDQTVNENTAITQVNAFDTSGGDTDIDGDTLTYACVYDTSIDSSVAGSTACTTLTGVSFDTATGIMDWTPSYTQAGSYEFKITATGGPDTLSDDELFSITVNNVDRAPVIATINDETVNENVAITQVNADDTSGGDTDIDGDSLTYTCQFDTTVSTTIVSGSNCTALPGSVSFNGSTGVLDWTPNYTAAANSTYEIEITATGGPDTLSDTEIFVITVNNVDRAPVIAAIGDQTVNENSAISAVNANDTSGGDTDIDGDTLTYSCQYDTTVGGGIVGGTACGSLPGSANFNTTTGELTWTPNYTAAATPTYEIEITATGGPDTLSDTEVFVITVNNVDRAPVIAGIANQTVNENSAITQVNANDTSGGDTDIDGDSLTYSCQYDNVNNGTIVSGLDCSNLPGTVSFDTGSGVFDWTPDYTAATTPTYEVEITATGGPDTLSDTEFFVITVNNVDRAPVLNTIADQPSAAENSAITTINASDTSGGDTDVDGDAITYSCTYDNTNDATVSGGTACTSLPGTVSFTAATGVLDWTPNYDAAATPVYEIKIVGTSGPDTLSDDEIFVVTVANTDRAPVLATIADQPGVTETTPITQINANDTSGGDTDIDGDAISYTCTYDTLVDNDVTAGTACTALSATFSTVTGILDWTPNISQSGVYEFKIVGSANGLEDDEIFIITVGNTDQPPVLAAIGDQTIDENTAMTGVNADDTSGGDTDVDGDAITYSCTYDTDINGAVGSGTDCSTITGLSFSTTFGTMTWTPNYSQAGTYEFKIVGTASPLSDDEIFSITVNNVDRAPVLATINDESVAENSAMTQVNANDTSGDDTDIDGDTITYACVYDTTADDAVAGSTACTTITGVTFNTTTGVMDWTPNYDQAGTFEFKITGTAGSLSDDEIFAITVTNTDRAPVLAAIGNETVNENSAITQVNADDTSGGDTDIDGDTITYSCLYDTTVSSGIVSGTACSSLPGSVTFNTTTGILDWTPDYTAAADSTYEIEITGTAGALSDGEIFVITVNNVDRAPVLAAIGNETVSENSAITQVNAQDVNGGDSDIDGDAITFSCSFDNTVSTSIVGGSDCTSLPGAVSFNTSTGVLDWIPNYDAAATPSYEIEITASANALSDTEFFVITVNNTDRAPVLATINDQTVAENSAITPVNAADTSGGDTDVDGDSITYACVYDTTIDTAVAGSTACTTLTGMTFNTSTGEMTWTPNYDQAGDYEFKITGTAGALSDDEIFSITVNNTDRAPVLATIIDQTVSENSAITQIDANDTSGGETDVDGDTITYACVYDTAIDSTVSATTDCTTITGVTFNTTSGVMDWTPDYDQAGNYEFKITGTAGALSDDEIFSITVNNTDRAPLLTAIGDQTVNENVGITTVNANDDNTGNDTDIDGDTITYACIYDTNIDTAVSGTTSCSTLTGVAFNTTTGVFDWTPNYSQAGNYEFKITGTAGSLSDDEIFSVTVNNADRAPVLASIGNQVVSENSAITTIDANENTTGNDTDLDGDAITYTCTYDTTIDADVTGGTNCTSLTGISFTAATGVITWTPNYDQAGVYEFKIVGSEGDLSDDEIFNITVNNTNRAPVLATISDQTVSENSAITQVNADDTSGGDTDVDGQTITYACVYDTTVDSDVAGTTACTTLTGISFNTTTGVMDWTPDYDQAGNYEFKITGSDGSLSDDEIFAITVNNTDRAPVLATINDETVAENSAITQVNANDNTTGNDTDVDGDTITYACVYDTNIDTAVSATTACTTITGLTFNSTTGVMDWTPNFSQANTYEFKITGTAGSLSDDEIFAITVTQTDLPPVLAAIGNQTVSENSAITTINANDDNTGNDTDRDGDTITYTCTFDTLIDAAVAAGADCSTLTGVSFTAGTGIMTWTPNYEQANTYEFKIVGSEGDLSDDEIFTITVNNVDRAPVIAAIGDQTVAENSAITQVDPSDTSGGDTDADGDTITYTCFYDQTIDGSVASSNTCISLTGVSFTSGTGVLDWTPNFDQAGDFEFKIVANEGDLTDDELFSITVTNTDRAPTLATINDETVNENVAITTVDANDNSGGDTDPDGDAITYTCTYDTTSDGAVAAGSNCTTITGLSFNGTSGVMDWTPDYDQAGTYEFKIVGSEGDLSDDEIFVITVNNVDRAPVLATIGNQTISENSAITQVDANDTSGGETDVDGDTITYACVYDTSIDSTVAGSTDCTTLTGLTFNTTTGVMDWTPDYDQANTYEFKITGTAGALSDDEIFSITVNNTDRAPVLATINDETVAENSAITQVNADDTSGGDTDIDGDTITYACVYDTIVDDAVAGSTSCTSLTGVTFNTTTGVMDWTPDFTQAGAYEFKVTGTAGALSDDEIFAITVTNTDQAPVLATINDTSVNENSALTTINAADTSGGDTDADGDTITYTCFYDQTSDGAVASTTACTTISGLSFTGATGVLDWTPDYTQAGTYEIKIVGSEGDLSDDEIFVITVNNVDRAPVLATINDETVAENSAITQVNANDTSGGDTDPDGDTITYSCVYDTTIDDAVAGSTACTTLTGVSFNTTTGVMDWTPNYDQAGAYEFKIVGDEGDLSDDEIFAITITNTDRAPVLAAIANQSVAELAAITQIDANDNSTGNDTDADGDTITYGCLYDTTVDGSISGGTNCTSLPGTVSFNTTTGVFDYTPNTSAANTYEIEITGTAGALSGTAIFELTVTNANQPPVLATIGDQTVNEGVAITQVNANDNNTGNDTDSDGDTITYSCLYDTTVSAGIVSGTACTSLPGTVSFNTSTGVFDWTPDFTAAAASTYEIEITGTANAQSDGEIFVITVNNVDQAPVLAAIGDETVSENSAITQVDANDNSTGNDTDFDGDTITYSCLYDQTTSGSIVGGTACTSLPGTVSFDTATGIFDWTPDYTAAGTYEIEITGSEGDLSDGEIFVITVNNLDRAPILAAIADQASAAENTAITQIDANDNVTGNDTDQDGDTLTYTCYYDQTSDGSVDTTNACTTLTGVSFTSATGVMDWTPSYTQAGTYEFRIIGSEGDLTDDEFFVVTVANTDRAPVLATINDETVSENSAITQVNADDTSGGDTDVDGDAITYSCLYDTTVSGGIVSGTACSSLPGSVTFTAATGVLDWTPDYTAAATPTYEIEITGTAGALSDGEIFVITVNNTDRAPVLAAIGNQNVSENAAITQINADDTSGGDTDVDGDTITYSCLYDTTISGGIVSGTTCSSLPGSVTFTAATGVLDWTPDYTAAGSYEIEITGTAGALSDGEIIEITVNNTDRAPTLAAIGNQTTSESVAITQVNANDVTTGNDTDPDGDTITYSCLYDTTISGAIVSGTACTSLPGTASFNTTTGVLDWTPNNSSEGDYEIEIIGSEGDLSDAEIFTVVVSNTNQAPVLAAIGDETVSENSAITQVDANDTSGGDTDVDGQALTYSCLYDTTPSGAIASGIACTSLPGSVTFNTTTGVLDWTPDFTAAGSYEIEITGSDGALSDGEIFVITVNNLDRAPTLAAIGDETVAENSPITQVDANDLTGGETDPDGDTITYSCLFDNTNDGSISGGTACTSLPGVVSFNTTTGVFDWTPDYTAAATPTYEIEITGSEGDLSDNEIFVITVTNTDRAPTLAAIGNQAGATENTPITTVNADDTSGGDTDPDGDTITYSCLYDTTISGGIVGGTACSSLPGTASFNTSTGVLDWTPNYDAVGDYELQITGSEGDLSDSVIFTITVANTDRAPVIAAIGDSAATENTAITAIDANDTSGGDTDVDGDTITYACVFDNSADAAVAAGTACTSLPGTATFDTGTGVLNWTPSYAAAATPQYEIKITATANALSDDEIFVITVANNDRAPVLATISPETVNENVAITQVDANDNNSGNDTDIDGDTITYTCVYDNTNDTAVSPGTACTSLPGTVSFNTGTGVLDWTPDGTTNDTSPTWEIKITGTAGALSDDEIFVITVNNVDSPPTLAAIGDQAVAENAAITQVNADDTTGGDTDPDGDIITYSCLYDNTNNGTITGGTACTSLPGTVSFNTTTGVFDWTPDFTAAGNPVYEIEITGTANALSDGEIFVITVSNTDQLPVLAAIADQAGAAENTAITTVDANENSTGNDTDLDGEAITYTCYYDNTNDGAVANTNLCTSLAGSAFNTATGVFDWTPDYSTNDTSPTWEFKITGTAGAASDDEFFVVTVANTDRAPVLAAIADEDVTPGSAITQINANDTNSATDVDIDGDTITYTCVYDQVNDGAVAAGSACTGLTGLTFNTATGVMNWTTQASDAGDYEFKITGTAGALSDDEIFVIGVLSPVLTWTDQSGTEVTVAAPYDFGANPAVATQSITLTNTGNQDTGAITIAFQGNPKTFTIVTDNCSATGATQGGGTCNVVIEWDPGPKPSKAHNVTVNVTPTNGPAANFNVAGTN